MAFWKSMWLRLNADGRSATVSPGSRVIRAQSTPAVVRYLDALLALLAERHADATLSSRDPLPRLAAPNEELPPGEQVINRLKVLSGLTPSTLTQPVSGRFEHPVRHRILRVNTQFVERGGESTCRLTVIDVTDEKAAAVRGPGAERTRSEAR